MTTRELWNRYAKYFNAEEGYIFPPDIPEYNFYKTIREEMPGLCLEIGAGAGRLAKYLSTQDLTVALEPSKVMLKSWSDTSIKSASRLNATGELMPFKDGLFPIVCFPYNGLQCVPDEKIRRGIVKEAYRVTACNGFFLLEVSPIFSRRDSEELTERYSVKMPDGSMLTLNERVVRKFNPDLMNYQMFYTTSTKNSSTTEELHLNLAVTTREGVINLLMEFGFVIVKQWGDYTRVPYNDKLSPRLLILARKGE